MGRPRWILAKLTPGLRRPKPVEKCGAFPKACLLGLSGLGASGVPTYVHTWPELWARALPRGHVEKVLLSWNES